MTVLPGHVPGADPGLLGLPLPDTGQHLGRRLADHDPAAEAGRQDRR